MGRTKEETDVRAQCTRFLSHHGVEAPAAALRRLAEYAPPGEQADDYGAGGAVARLEERTAVLLGKPAARFFIKGVTAQLCTLQVHAEASGRQDVALHPLSHLDYDEAGAVERVGGLRAVRVGRLRPFDVGALEAITEPLGIVVVELPLRRAGYLLPPWDDLVAISNWCRDKGIPLHIDGARLWEAAAGYGVRADEIAALADTVYVSFYKGLGGLGGAALAGSVEHVRALGTWKTRLGGDLVTAYPQALSALAGIERNLTGMMDHVQRARSLASRLGAIPGVLVNPPRPDVNAFQLYLPGSAEETRERHLAVARRHGVWLFNAFSESALVNRTMVEVAIGMAAGEWSDDDVVAWIQEMLTPGE